MPPGNYHDYNPVIVHSCSYLIELLFVPGTVLSTGDRAVKKMDRVPVLSHLYSLNWCTVPTHGSSCFSPCFLGSASSIFGGRKRSNSGPLWESGRVQEGLCLLCTTLQALGACVSSLFPGPRAVESIGEAECDEART